MKVTIRPSQLNGTVAAPPSKSMAHRYLICAGLARSGVSLIHGIELSEDVLATIDCLRALGAEITVSPAGSGLCDLTVRGTDPLHAAPATLNCRESGSTLRFFVPLCALSGSRMALTGSERLMQRPLSVYEDIFSSRGVSLEPGITVEGRLTSGEYTMDGSVSSQFISGMLFTLPLLEGDSVLRLTPPVESRPYIDMTIESLAAFGVTATWQDDATILIPGGQHYEPREAAVPGDWSNAAFFLAMGLDVTGLDRASLQGDKIIEQYLENLRACGEGAAGSVPELNIRDCPDLGPLLMAYAALNHGCRLTGTARLRIKESDRGAAMQEELAKFGVKADIEDNSITVGSGVHAPSEVLCGHNDHRIVMALSVMCLETGGTIDGAEAVRKSFPAYFDRLAELGADFVTD